MSGTKRLEMSCVGFDDLCFLLATTSAKRGELSLKVGGGELQIKGIQVLLGAFEDEVVFLFERCGDDL